MAEENNEEVDQVGLLLIKSIDKLSSAVEKLIRYEMANAKKYKTLSTQLEDYNWGILETLDTVLRMYRRGK